MQNIQYDLPLELLLYFTCVHMLVLLYITIKYSISVHIEIVGIFLVLLSAG